MRKLFTLVLILSFLVNLFIPTIFTNQAQFQKLAHLKQNDYLVKEREVKNLSFLNVSEVKALSLDVTFAKTFGGKNDDYLNSITKTKDGGYIAVGKTQSSGVGKGDFLVLKFNSSLNLEWAYTYGGWEEDTGYSICQTNDGNFVVVGTTFSFGSSASDILVLKISNNGTIIFSKTFGGKYYDGAYCVKETSDNGCIVVGYTNSFGAGNSDVFVIKLDSSLNLIWAKTFGLSNFDEGRFVEKTSDGGYIVVGTSLLPNENGEILVFKLSSDGNLIWAKTYGGSRDEVGISIKKTPDNGYILIGNTQSFGAGYFDCLVAKLRSDGTVTWAKTFGGSGKDYANAVVVTSDNKYAITGYTSSFGLGSFETFFVELSKDGNLISSKTFGEKGEDYGNALEKLDSGFVLVGYTSSFGEGFYDCLVLKMDESGNIGNCKYLNNFNPGLTSQMLGFYEPSLTVKDVTNIGLSVEVIGIPYPTIKSNVICGETETFTITATNSFGGMITPSGVITVSKGSTQTFTITPDKDFEIEDVKVDGVSKGAITTYTFTNITSNHTISVTFKKKTTTIILQIGNPKFTVNGIEKTLDSPPIIKNGRTLVPIRAIVESLGGTVSWNEAERKVTVSLGLTTVELWIGKNTAKVNGETKQIDPDNPKVVPEIINNRTMLPLRFIAESLGATVTWEQSTKKITIVY